ncbi:MAG TPA: efflux RND transporter periplasmic adaptor subunit [Desulfomonilia bacterium]
MKKAVIFVIIVIIVGASAYFILKRENSGNNYKTEKVEKGDIQLTVTATGTVNAVVNVQVGTQVSGTISTIFVDYNSLVKKGQLLAQIDPANFESQVAQAKANLSSAEANHRKTQVVLADNLRTLARNKALLKKDFVSQSDVDTAQTNADSASAQVDAAKAQVEQMKAALKVAETNLGYTRILSPVDGTVISRNVDVGQTVAASYQTPTLFTIAQDLREMQIDTNVDEADIGKIKNMQSVEFTIDAYPDMTFKGVVSEVRNSPTTVSNVVTYDVIVKVDNLDLKLKPGMTANVTIIVDEKKDVLKVPDSALRFKPAQTSKNTNGRNGSAVWVMDNGKIKRIPVRTGISDGSYTEVVSGGIREGNEVITESADSDKDTAKSSSRHVGPPPMF